MNYNSEQIRMGKGFALREGVMPAPNMRGVKPEREGTDSLVTWLAQDSVFVECGAFYYPGPVPKTAGAAWYTIAQWTVEDFGQEVQLLGYRATVGSPDPTGVGYATLPVGAFPGINTWVPLLPGTFGGDQMEKTLAPSCCMVIMRNGRLASPGSWTNLGPPSAGMSSAERLQTTPGQRIVIHPPTSDLGNGWMSDFVKENQPGALSPGVFPIRRGDTLSVCAVFAPGTSYPNAADQAWAWPVWCELRLGYTVNQGGYTS